MQLIGTAIVSSVKQLLIDRNNTGNVYKKINIFLSYKHEFRLYDGSDLKTYPLMRW